jgi:prepilin-type N-terminal cleavage/methylation domain-containing protein
LATTEVRRREVSILRRKSQGGFSLIEVVISMAILTIGLVCLLGVFGIAMAATQDSQQDMLAKQLANEALESIVTARNTSQKQWADIQNVSDGGIFLPGYQPLYDAGTDGIMGTVDDSAAGYQKIHEPGPDGIYGTSDDVLLPMSNYQRKIEILPVTDINGNVVASLRSVNISVQYTPPRVQRTKTYLLTSFVSQFR